MSDIKMSDVEVVDYPEWTLKDFLPDGMAIINRSGLPAPIILEIVKRSSWMQVVDVHGDDRDAKLVLKALVSYDTNQALIASQAETIAKQQKDIELLRGALSYIKDMPEVTLDIVPSVAARALASTKSYTDNTTEFGEDVRGK